DFKHWKLTKDFTKIPNELITDGSLSVTQRLILIYIKSHKEDYIYTVKQIAESLGLNINTVKINLRKLESMNIIKQEKIAQSSNYHRSVTKNFHQEKGFTKVSNKLINIVSWTYTKNYYLFTFLGDQKNGIIAKEKFVRY